MNVAWEETTEPDGCFMSDAEFEALFGGDILLGVTGGAQGMLEPVLLRHGAACRDTLCWKRGDTTAGTAGLLALNGLTAADISARALALIGRAAGRR